MSPDISYGSTTTITPHPPPSPYKMKPNKPNTAFLKLSMAITLSMFLLAFLADTLTQYSLPASSPHLRTPTPSPSTSISTTSRNLEEETETCSSDIDLETLDCSTLYTSNLPPACRCAFATSCSSSTGLPLPAKLAYCMNDPTLGMILGILLSIFTLILLFLTLGSTADSYFSPSLQQFSHTLGLPPRFAGVSLLALGNGAADVSSTISAILASPNEGYKLALGSLSGGGMFISTVIVSAIIYTTKPPAKVTCKGAMVRDIVALALTSVLVMGVVLPGGGVTKGGCWMFLGYYLCFVLVVFGADVFHRRGKIMERVGGSGAAGDFCHDNGNDNDNDNNIESNDDNTTLVPKKAEAKGKRFERILAAFSNYDTTGMEDSGWVESLDAETEVTLTGGEGGGEYNLMSSFEIEDDLTSDDLALANNNTGGDGDASNSQTSRQHQPWKAFTSSAARLRVDLQTLLSTWRLENFNSSTSRLTQTLTLLESPLTLLRSSTVPITADEEYVPQLLIVSLLASPFFLSFYFWFAQGLPLVSIWLPVVLCVNYVLAGYVLMKPDGEHAHEHELGKVRGGTGLVMWVSVPIALYGFVIAAMWIDLVASLLVSNLTFLATLTHLPPTILGLTILAWGNSIGDLSTNISMSKRGFGSMAITACFAGPVFNLLVGLGAGLLMLLQQQVATTIKLNIEPPIVTGLICIVINCACVLYMGVVRGGGCWTGGMGMWLEGFMLRIFVFVLFWSMLFERKL